jgi:imidazolonepropionase-like amidohydrolase
MKTFLATIIAVFTGLVAILFLLPGPAGPAHGGPVAFTDARVFDGQRVIDSATLVLADGRVAALGRDVDIPERARVISAAGRTVLPGLIDAHVHAFGDARRDALRMGVTTLLDMFTDPTGLSLSRQQRRSLTPKRQADLFSAGFLATAEGGHGTQYGLPVPIPRSPADADRWVAERLEEGSDYIKIVIEDGSGWGRSLPTLDEPMVRALVTAAHARDVLAVAHVSTRSGARMAVEAGVDGLVHVFADRPVDDDFLELANEAGIFVTPTAAVLAASHGQPLPAWLLEAEAVGERVNRAQRQMLEQEFPGASMRASRWPVVLDNIARLHAAGVPILAGSDAGNPGTAHGPSLHHELKLLVDAGLSPLEALEAATSRPTAVFDLGQRGCLQVGCRADLVVVEGNPLEDIRHSVRISSVWKNGHRLPTAAGADGGRREATMPP